VSRPQTEAKRLDTAVHLRLKSRRSGRCWDSSGLTSLPSRGEFLKPALPTESVYPRVGHDLGYLLDWSCPQLSTQVRMLAVTQEVLEAKTLRVVYR
jgi:hypothetical protein